MRHIALLLLGILTVGAAAPLFAKPDDLKGYVLWFLPAGTQRVPLVIMLEGNGGTRQNARSPWVDWFNERGIAVAQVRSAAARNRSDWSGVGCGLQYRDDARDAIDLARVEQPRIDTTRFAIIGLSRGGSEALNSHRGFQGAAAQPSAVFAFYPGCEGWCRTDYPSTGPTAVHILYGDADQWGKLRDTYSYCRRLAGGSIMFHNVPGAHHGFDNRGSGSFTASGGQSFRYEPNPAGLEQARALMRQVLAPAWGLSMR